MTAKYHEEVMSLYGQQCIINIKAFGNNFTKENIMRRLCQVRPDVFIILRENRY